MTATDAPETDPPRREILLADYRPPAYAIDRVEMTVDLQPRATRVDTVLSVARAADTPADAPLCLDLEDMVVERVAVDGRVLGDNGWRIAEGRLVIADMPARAQVETRVVLDPQANTRLEGLYLSGETYCTQCEAEGFRRITPFIDRPDVMATYRVTVRGDAARQPVLLSNGNRVASRPLPGGRHEAVFEDPFAKPSYLFALVAGDLAAVTDRFVTRSGRPVDLAVYVEPGNEPRAGYALDALKRAMRWDEDRFGLEYDLDVFSIVAVDFFNMGAMENKGLNVFNAKYVLADPDLATDSDYELIESIVAHEYFHNWTGNRVTCRDWFQLSLKEGLTVFRDQQFSADMRSAAVQRIRAVRQLRSRQFPEDAGPLAHPVRPDRYVEINNFYTPTVYEKGAEVVGMLHTLLGAEGFRRGMDLYFQRHDGAAVTCDDFTAAMADAGGVDLAAFKRWYAQAGTPRVAVTAQHDAAAETLTLTFSQSCPATPGQRDKQPLVIPFAIGLVDEAGAGRPIRLAEDSPAAPVGDTRVLWLSAGVERVTLTGCPTPGVVSLNRGFSAPVIVEHDYSDAGLGHLMAHDGDAFNRWEAGQQLATRLIVAAATGPGDARAAAAAAAPPLAEALGRVLEVTAETDLAFAAEMLVLPGLGTLVDAVKTADVDRLHAAREGLLAALATALGERLTGLLDRLAEPGPFSLDAAAAGRRTLRSAALGLLAAIADRPGGAAVLARIVDQARDAQSMTDRIGALAALNRLDRPERTAALADFRRRYDGETLALDKWLALEASAPLAGTLARVRAVMGDSAFDAGNPNRLRALIGTFASANLVCFHAADGAGYDFLAEQVLALDPRNPQTAARLVLPLARWRRFTPDRQRLMRAALDRIAGAGRLSADLWEVVEKARA